MMAVHAADNVKLPDGLWHSSVAVGMLSVTHSLSVVIVILHQLVE